MLNFVLPETAIEIFLLLFSSNFYKTFQCVKNFPQQCVNLEWQISENFFDLYNKQPDLLKCTKYKLTLVFEAITVTVL